MGLQQNLWVGTGSEYAPPGPPRGSGSCVVIAQRGEPSVRRVMGESERGIGASAV